MKVLTLIEQELLTDEVNGIEAIDGVNVNPRPGRARQVGSPGGANVGAAPLPQRGQPSALCAVCQDLRDRADTIACDVCDRSAREPQDEDAR